MDQPTGFVILAMCLYICTMSVLPWHLKALFLLDISSIHESFFTTLASWLVPAWALGVNSIGDVLLPVSLPNSSHRTLFIIFSSAASQFTLESFRGLNPNAWKLIFLETWNCCRFAEPGKEAAAAADINWQKSLTLISHQEAFFFLILLKKSTQPTLINY